MVLAFDQLQRGRESAEAATPNLIHEFFERQADQRPSHPAVECNGEALTYAELDRQSNQIAHFLRSRGVGPENLVGLYLRKSSRLFAAILGVLKSGAGYVPIDPQTPAGRVRLIADDAKLSLLLTEDLLLQQLDADPGAALVSLDDAASEIARQPKSRLTAAGAALMPSNVCYVIYTSGSTGRPKGVVLEHRNVANYIAALQAHYGIGRDDRVYQGFSVAFDASVEEIWAALANGGTLVVPAEDIAKSPHETADFIRSRKLTVFSTVPTFLSLITTELPSVKLIIVGGEACPAQLVTRWANGKRRMLNTYGPTETSVVATIAECVPDEAVSIGTAMTGYSTRVLDDELRDVAVGEVGELYIGGKSLARGYMNLPDLTAENFLILPCQFKDGTERFYRTHDLVRLTPARTLEFLGRADDQVKVRGFRIELSEIEAVLMEHPSVRSAAVTVHEHNNMKEIAAYVVPAGGLGSRQKSGIADLLSTRLPEYMFPKYLEIVDELPTMNSGKVDRKRLPKPENAFVAADRAHVPAETDIESEIVRVWEEQLDVRHISVEADFFLDLRGNSFTAAHVATELRTRLGTLQISSKDIYTYRTVRDLARHLAALGVSVTDPTTDSAPATAEPSSMQAMRVGVLMRWTCAFLQTISIGCFYATISAPLIYAILICERVYKGQMSLETAITVSTYVSLAIWPSWLLLSIALKWLVIGRYKAGRYPVWGFYYFRWWLVSRFQGIGWPEMFSGTPLMSLYYRAMGAKIGKNCTIGTPLCTAFDLVSIGEDSSIGVDAQLLGYRVENGWLILGTIDIGRECFVGMQTALGLNVVMQDRSRLADMSLLPDGASMSAGAQQAGSPPVDAHVECPIPAETASRRRYGFLFGLLHLALIYVMGYVLILSMLPSILLVWYCQHRWGLFAGAMSVFVAIPVATLWYPILTILIKRCFIGRIKPGTFPVASVRYLRYWFLDYMMNNTRLLLLPMYATVFLPTFLRLMGARIGKGVEISTIMHVVPDLIDVGDGSFLADGCIVGGHRIYRGLIDIRPNTIGRRTFVGNSALVPGGTDVGKDSLIGVMSTPPADQLRAPDGTRWLGSPSFEVPSAPEKCCFGESQTYSPRTWMRCVRTALDTSRILLPGAIVAAQFLIFCVTVICLDSHGPLWLVLVAAPLIAFYLSLVSLVWVARVKSLLIGTFTPTVKPLWSSFVWLNEVVNGVYETVGAAALLPLMGTPYIATFLRRMGCHIGRWVFLETTLFSEFDLVEIGDCAALNLGSTVQTHLFEDRVMKADRLKIGAGCSVGNMAVVLYGSEMKDGSSLAPLSVLMKGDTLPAQSRWYGIPNQPQDVPPPLAPSQPLDIGGRIRLPRVEGPFSTLTHAGVGGAR